MTIFVPGPPVDDLQADPARTLCFSPRNTDMFVPDVNGMQRAVM
jgi:hypothetical protein